MKKIKSTLVSFFILLLFVQCSIDSDDESLDTFDKIDSDYSVYSAILNQGFDRIDKPLVVEQTTDTSQSLSFDDNAYVDRIEPEGIGKAVYNDLIIQNDSIGTLENKFEISPRQVQLITFSDLQAAFLIDDVNGGWDEFYKKYPDSEGYIRFSKVGFNTDKTEALVEYAYVFGNLGADGGFVYLERESSGWILKKFVPVWAS